MILLDQRPAMAGPFWCRWISWLCRLRRLRASESSILSGTKAFKLNPTAYNPRESL